MYRIIVIDDEAIMLARFARIVADEKRVQLIGKFNWSEDALEFIRTEQVDIAFIDIQMPGMTGLEIAEAIRKLQPTTECIFVTAYSEYAMEAFHVNAFGYILKPIQLADISRHIDHYERRFSTHSGSTTDPKLRVQTFGGFMCYPPDGNQPISWKRAKARELFALLVLLNGLGRSMDYLCEALWPEADEKSGANRFHVTCNSLRTQLNEVGITDAVCREHDLYYLNFAHLDCDLHEYMSNENNLEKMDLPALTRLSNMYQGAYMEGCAYDWGLETRTWAESVFKKIQLRICNLCLSAHDSATAISALERLILLQPLDDDQEKQLLDLMLSKNMSYQAQQFFSQYASHVQSTYGESVSPEIERFLHNAQAHSGNPRIK